MSIIKNVALVILLFLPLGVGVVAQTCIPLDLVSDSTVPLGTTKCGHVSSQCSTLTIVADTYTEGSYAIAVHYPTRIRADFPDISAGSTYSRTYLGAEYAIVYDGFNEVYVVDFVECAAEEAVVYPPDDRVNWQSGDHHVIIFLEGDYVELWLPHDGYAEWVASFFLDDNYSGYGVEYADGRVVVTDNEGKVFSFLLEE